MTRNNQTLPLPLPFQATRGKAMQFVAPTFLSVIFLVAFVFLYLLPMKNPDAPLSTGDLKYIFVGAIAASDLIAAIVFFRTVKPAYVEISRATITVTPMPILGFAYGTQTYLSPSDFSHVELKTFNTNPGPTYKVTLCGKEGTESLALDFPKDMQPRAFAEGLASALNLELKNA